MRLARETVPLKIRRRRGSKSVAIRFDAVREEVTVSAPLGLSTTEIGAILESRRLWLEDQFEEVTPRVELAPGQEFACEGEPLRIDWQADFPRKPTRFEGSLRLGGPEDCVERRVVDWLKQLGRERFGEDLADYCQRAGCDMPKLSIGDARFRWGSCSSRSGIRLNWRLIMAPVSIRRSVVAHEVAHIRHMNHSAAFYRHLDQIFEGDRKAADAWLRAHGNGLRRIGPIGGV